MSQVEFSEKLGLSRAAIQAWEDGRRNVRSKHVEIIESLIALRKMQAMSYPGVDVNAWERLPTGGFSISAGVVPILQQEEYVKLIDNSDINLSLRKVTYKLEDYREGKYQVWEIKGDSMWNGGGYDTPDKAEALAINIVVEDLENAMSDSKYGFVIVTDQVIFKDIVDVDFNQKFIVCHSRSKSPEYSDFTLPLSEIREIWKVLKRTF